MMIDEINQNDPGVVLSARGLTKEFSGFRAVDNVNIDIHHARIHALIGPNGAGKTTVFNLLTKFIQPTSGRITLLGTDITQTPPAEVARMGLARSFQISAVFPHLTVLENVRIALQRPNGLATQFWLPLSSLNRLNGRAEVLLGELGLAEFRDVRAAELSYGRKRVLEIATTLALDPEVLLLDEPMAGLGQEDIRRVADLIREVARHRAVLMVEHNLSIISEICHTVTVLQRGKVIAHGDYATVAGDAVVREAYMGADR